MPNRFLIIAVTDVHFLCTSVTYVRHSIYDKYKNMAICQYHGILHISSDAVVYCTHITLCLQDNLEKFCFINKINNNFPGKLFVPSFVHIISDVFIEIVSGLIGHIHSCACSFHKV